MSVNRDRELGKLAAKKLEYQLYAQADDSTRETLDVMYSVQATSLNPPIALALRAACGEVPDEELISRLLVYSEKSIPDDAPSFVIEVSKLPVATKGSINNGLASLTRHFAGQDPPTVGYFRSLADVDALKVKNLGIERIAFIQFVLGSKNTKNAGS